MEQAAAFSLVRDSGRRSAQDDWARAYDDLPVGLALFRPSGELLYANQAYRAIVAGAGHNPAAMRFPEASTLFRLDALQSSTSPQGASEPGRRHGATAEHLSPKFQGVEKCLELPGGLFAWYRTQVSWMTRKGAPPYLRLVVDDVTRYRERVGQLLDRHKLYRGFVELRADPLCRFLPDLSLLYANASFAKCFGRARREVASRNFLDLIAPQDRPRLVAALETITPSSPSAEMEQRLAWPDGRTLWIKWTFQGFFYRTGHIKDYQAVGLDISEHKHAEQCVFHAGRLVSLGALVSSVAHEVNNPNNFIMLNAPLLAAIWDKAMPLLRRAASPQAPGRPEVLDGVSLDQMDADVRGLLCGIAEGASRIKNIVGELKQYARLTDGEALSLVSADEIVASAVVLLGKTIRTHTHHLRVARCPDPPLVKGHAQRLEQVVINLIQNACQALDNPSKAIEIATFLDRQDDTVRITVRDEGVGISPEDLPRVTDPFFSTRSGKGGTGLGLPICVKILKEHGGRLELESIPGQGALARIILPAAG